MNTTDRRDFLKTVSLTALAVAGGGAGSASGVDAARGRRRMTIHFVGGAIGVSANQRKAIELAHRHGFESVEAQGEFLTGLEPQQLQELAAEMKSKNLVFGAAGLPVDFRQDPARFEEGLNRLPRIAAGLERAGVTRMGTWISPCHDTLTYLQNFKQHSARLRQVAEILKAHGIRLGLEYVGTQTLRNSRKYPFVHTMAETLELIAGIGTGNVGLVLDSWHWWTAGDTEADILSLHNEQVVAGDLNDAPAGIPKDQQRDGQRELPCATGVIDTGVFLNALARIGFDGPMRAEPFNKPLNDLDDEAACAATAAAMKKAFALIR